MLTNAADVLPEPENVFQVVYELPKVAATISRDNYIHIVHHPRTHQASEHQPLDVPADDKRTAGYVLDADDHQDALAFLDTLALQRPWLPLRTRADLEFMYLATRLQAHGKDLEDLIRGVGPSRLRETRLDIDGYQHPYEWHGPPLSPVLGAPKKSRDVVNHITFTSVKDFEAARAQTRKYVLSVSYKPI
jgi:hypothetical protein